MEGVRDEPQAVGPHAVEQLDKRKGEVDEQEEEEVAHARVRQDCPLCGEGGREGGRESTKERGRYRGETRREGVKEGGREGEYERERKG